MENESGFKNPVLHGIFGSPRWMILWLAAVLLLFVNLGVDGISGSEGRWMTVAREMIASGDYLHPTINGQLYFDKPLVSYWFIVLCAWINGGIVNEFVSRVPSALSALFALGCVILLVRRLWNEKTACASAWILLSIYSFAFWGRLAEADMENLAFILAAVTWYFYHRDRQTVSGYAVFAMLCAIGGQTKGLGAVVLPAVIVGIDMGLTKSIRRHINWKMCFGVLIGLLVYFIPFLLEAMTRGDYSSAGLALVFRENIERFFNPFDHNKDPFWIYFVYLPQLFIPWTPFLVLAIVWAVMDWKKSGDAERWLLLTIAAVFLIFSASGSRRLYYILPILPFCAILCGLFLNAQLHGFLKKINKILLMLYDGVVVLGGFAFLILPILFFFFHRQIGLPELAPFYKQVIHLGSPIIGVGLLLFQTFMRKKQEKQLPVWSAETLYPAFGRAMAVVWVSMFLVFGFVIPFTDADPAFRTSRPFLRDMHVYLLEEQKLPSEKILFFGKNIVDATYYLDFPKAVEVIEREEVERLRPRIEEFLMNGGAVIAEQRDLLRLPEELRKHFLSDELTFIQDGSVQVQPLSVFEQQFFQETVNEKENPKSYKKLRKKQASILRKKIVVKVFPAGENAE